jgi:hypothetical protein
MRCFHLAATLIASMTLAPSVVHAGCVIFQHRDFGGSHYWLDSNDTMKMVNGKSTCTTTGGKCPECKGCTFFEPSWNDQVSSFAVDPGCTITLWEDVNEHGAYFRSSRSYSYVGDDWNDVASEAICTCP